MNEKCTPLAMMEPHISVRHENLINSHQTYDPSKEIFESPYLIQRADFGRYLMDPVFDLFKKRLPARRTLVAGAGKGDLLHFLEAGYGLEYDNALFQELRLWAHDRIVEQRLGTYTRYSKDSFGCVVITDYIHAIRGVKWLRDIVKEFLRISSDLYFITELVHQDVTIFNHTGAFIKEIARDQAGISIENMLFSKGKSRLKVLRVYR